MIDNAASLAFVFPGQGSQTPGMLAELAQAHLQVREVFAEAASAIDVDLWSISQAPDDERLNQTEYTQPALLTAGIAVWRAWKASGGASPMLLAGHSLGEYTALVAAGALSLADGVRLVRQRGRLMQAAVPSGTGTMAAVLGAEDDVVAQVCAAVSGEEVVVPANYNSPGQIVIGGHVAAVDRAIAEFAARGIRKVVKLPVSVPSHTPLMREAAARLAEVMETLDWQTPGLPVVQNVDGHIRDDIDAIRDALVRQLFEPVRWTTCVEVLRDRSAARVGECGPGKVLTGLVKRIDRAIDVRALGMPADFDAAVAEWTA